MSRDSIGAQGYVVQLYVPPLLRVGALALIVSLPAILITSGLGATTFHELWRQPKYLSSKTLLLATMQLVILTVFANLGSIGMRPKSQIQVTHDRAQWLYRFATTAGVIALIAYAVWLTLAVLRGLSVGDIGAMAAGESGSAWRLKNVYLAPIGGVTSWMQLAVIYFALLPLVQRMRRMPTGLTASLLVLTFFRGLFASERLAVIEIAVPYLLCMIIVNPQIGYRFRGLGRSLAWMALAWLALASLFAMFEYFRSWRSYYAYVFDGSYAEFVAFRLFGYYATSINNSALLQLLDGGGPRLNALSLGLNVEAALGTTSAPYAAILASYSNPEFNNSSGLLTGTIALGPAPAILLMAVFGFVIGRVQFRMTTGRDAALLSLLTYLVLAVSLLEFARLFYIGDSRFLPILLALLLARSFWNRSSKESFHAASSERCHSNSSTSIISGRGN